MHRNGRRSDGWVDPARVAPCDDDQRYSGVDIELLYFGGCPNVEGYLPHLRELVATTSHRLIEREIIDEKQAVASSFLGSPTVRIDGRDI